MAQTAVSLLSFLAAWMLLSRELGESVLPGPLTTAQALWREYSRGDLLYHLARTSGRVLFAFGLAMVVGAAAGIAMGASVAADRVGESWVLVGLAIPRLVPIVCAYLLIGLNDLAAVVAIAITVAPMVAVQVREGTQAIDWRLVQMARAFRRPAATILGRVVIPQLLPYLVGTARAGMSQTWKMVVLAELMGRTNGVGYQIAFFFQMWDMRGILAYGLAMVLLLGLIDRALFGTLQRMVFHWRQPVKSGVLE